MSIIRLSERDVATRHGFDAFDALEQREVSAVAVLDATYDIYTAPDGKQTISFPWVNSMESLVPDRETELGGSQYLPDMPAHIDPHSSDRLKVHLTLSGLAVAYFALDFPEPALDEYNELPIDDYDSYGIETDVITLEPGDVVCFYGSTTLHEFTSAGQHHRESLVNSYRPVN